MLLGGWQEGHPACKKTEWWGAGVVICLERGADLHIAQLMPLPLTVSCFSKIQIGFTFLVPAHPGSPGQRAIKRVCVCVCVVLLVLGLVLWSPSCEIGVNGRFRDDLSSILSPVERVNQPRLLALAAQPWSWLLSQTIRITCLCAFWPFVRYDTRCYFNVCSKANMSQLNLPHGKLNLPWFFSVQTAWWRHQ